MTADVKIGIPIHKVIDSIARAVERLLARADVVKVRERRESVGKLALELASLAGKEEGLAEMLMPFANDSALGHTATLGAVADPMHNVLNAQLSSIADHLVSIRGLLSKLDLDSIKGDINLVADIGRFSHDAVFVWWWHGDKIPLVDNKRVTLLVSDLKREGKETQKLCWAAKRYHRGTTDVNSLLSFTRTIMPHDSKKLRLLSAHVSALPTFTLPLPIAGRARQDGNSRDVQIDRQEGRPARNWKSRRTNNPVLLTETNHYRATLARFERFPG